ncbi:MAG TPA: DEAD/DEAH box helicase [Pseudoclavibacter sp.]|nr:DEAD/DEAH box helicase [Pseudoclavibacter sp.]
MVSTTSPLIVQSDRTVLLELDNPHAQEARHELAVFAELERAPEHIHTYRITRLGLWNARAAGHTSEEVLSTLDRYAKFPVPDSVRTEIIDSMARYGLLSINRDGDDLILSSSNAAVLQEVASRPKIAELLTGSRPDGSRIIGPWARGQLKQALLKLGWPAEDNAGYTPGEHLPITLDMTGWTLRDYQREAAAKFTAGGSGVVVLPCGAGKTIVGAAAMAQISRNTLILVTNTVSARQWRSELLARTTLTEDEIGEYSGESKEIRPVTIATYQILTTRRKGAYAHLDILNARDWGLIIYDEVHLLPAPVFKLTADLQARRRLGLTATLVREDGREGDVFSLIGPKRFDAPWKELESQGFISPAECIEVRVTMPDDERLRYAAATDQERYRIAATSASKLPVLRRILDRHAGEQTLIIGQYLDQIAEVSEDLGVPSLTGQTPVAEREALYDAFRRADISTLVVSKVANFSIDLPDASVAIQISGSFGSRQEEAQRLGRILRPKSSRATAHFYTIVMRDTVDQDFALHRQRFLAEQGYRYTILDQEDL